MKKKMSNRDKTFWAVVIPVVVLFFGSSRSTCFLSNGNLPAAPCREKGGTSLI